MATAKTFFSKELTQLHQDINRLERVLKSYALDDPRINGIQAELRLERKNEEIVKQLAEYAEDPVTTLLQCRIMQRKSQQAHARSRNGSPKSTLRSNDWWNTLSEEQYLTDLNRRFENWLREQRANNNGSSNGSGF